LICAGGTHEWGVRNIKAFADKEYGGPCSPFVLGMSYMKKWGRLLPCEVPGKRETMRVGEKLQKFRLLISKKGCLEKEEEQNNRKGFFKEYGGSGL